MICSSDTGLFVAVCSNGFNLYTYDGVNACGFNPGSENVYLWVSYQLLVISYQGVFQAGIGKGLVIRSPEMVIRYRLSVIRGVSAGIGIGCLIHYPVEPDFQLLIIISGAEITIFSKFQPENTPDN